MPYQLTPANQAGLVVAWRQRGRHDLLEWLDSVEREVDGRGTIWYALWSTPPPARPWLPGHHYHMLVWEVDPIGRGRACFPDQGQPPPADLARALEILIDRSVRMGYTPCPERAGRG